MLEIGDRNSARLEIGMLKLRKGIDFPIIPEDFLHSEQESKTKARKPSFASAGRILSQNSDTGEHRSYTGKKNREERGDISIEP